MASMCEHLANNCGESMCASCGWLLAHVAVLAHAVCWSLVLGLWSLVLANL